MKHDSLAQGLLKPAPERVARLWPADIRLIDRLLPNLRRSAHLRDDANLLEYGAVTLQPAMLNDLSISKVW